MLLLASSSTTSPLLLLLLLLLLTNTYNVIVVYSERVTDSSVECCQELELPEEDCLYGLRVHSWVLVLQGKRDVSESFFIEPLTGLAHPVDSANYLGIESVWNHCNYWVNMQDCSEGVTVSYLLYSFIQHTTR